MAGLDSDPAGVCVPAAGSLDLVGLVGTPSSPPLGNSGNLKCATVFSSQLQALPLQGCMHKPHEKHLTEERPPLAAIHHA